MKIPPATTRVYETDQEMLICSKICTKMDEKYEKYYGERND